MFLQPPVELDADFVFGDIVDEEELGSCADLYYTGELRYMVKLPWH